MNRFSILPKLVTRWFFFLLMGISAFFISCALAQVSPSNNVADIKPWLQVKTVSGEEQIVRGFISPNCQYSKQYFSFFKNLQATIPSGETFMFTPLINKGDGAQYALAFFAIQSYYPKYLNNFIQASMEGAQDRMISTKSWAGLERIAQAAHLPVGITQLVFDHQNELKIAVLKSIQLQADLKITNTPSIAVAGTYIVTPEFTFGDMSQFSQLVNGIISMTVLR